MSLIRTIRCVLLIGGIQATSYTVATPGDQLGWAILGGVLIGAYVSFEELE